MLFRSRSLKRFSSAVATVWQEGVLNMAEFSKRLGTSFAVRWWAVVADSVPLSAVDKSTAGQVIKRLRNENFIVEKSVDQSGKKSRKTVKVSVVNKYVFTTRFRIFGLTVHGQDDRSGTHQGRRVLYAWTRGRAGPDACSRLHGGRRGWGG